MENEYLDQNDLRAKFRSKSDLWKRMSVDIMNSYLLSSYIQHSFLIRLSMTNNVYKEDLFLWKEARVVDLWYLYLITLYFRFIKYRQVIYFEIAEYS